MSQTFTPPIVNTAVASTQSDLMNMASSNMLPGGIIRQSNDILYGNQFQSSTINLSPTIAGPPPTPTPMFQQFQQPINQMSHHQFMPAVNPVQQTFEPAMTQKLPNPHPDNPGQLTNILQSLDTRLGKIESQLVFQNQQMGQQNQCIHNIESHVEQITVLKQCMTTVQNKVYTIETDMSCIKTKQTEYDTSISTYSSLCDEVLKSQDQMNKRIDQISSTLNFLQVSEIENIKSEHANLREDFLDTKCRQMCENLIFTGINEIELRPGEQENCERTLIGFLGEHMQIYDQIQFDRVHRLGRYRRNQARPRPIIAKFHEYRAKEMIKTRAPTALRNTQFGVREQYPDEYERRRKVLYPKMKAAKANSENKVRLVKDTLYINNEKYICGQNNAPVKVVYQSWNRGQNFSTQTVPDNTYVQQQGRRMTETPNYVRPYSQNQYSHQSLFTGPPPPPPRPPYNDTQRGPTPGTPQNYINFESANPFGPLQRDDPGYSRNYAGKTKASESPLENQTYGKKQKDDVSVSENAQTAMELTAESGSQSNNPGHNSEIPTTSSLSVNENPTQSDTSNVNTELSPNSSAANQSVTNSAENQEIHEQV